MKNAALAKLIKIAEAEQQKIANQLVIVDQQIDALTQAKMAINDGLENEMAAAAEMLQGYPILGQYHTAAKIKKSELQSQLDELNMRRPQIADGLYQKGLEVKRLERLSERFKQREALKIAERERKMAEEAALIRYNFRGEG